MEALNFLSVTPVKKPYPGIEHSTPKSYRNVFNGYEDSEEVSSIELSQESYLANDISSDESDHYSIEESDFEGMDEFDESDFTDEGYGPSLTSSELSQKAPQNDEELDESISGDNWLVNNLEPISSDSDDSVVIVEIRPQNKRLVNDNNESVHTQLPDTPIARIIDFNPMKAINWFKWYQLG